MQQSGSEDEKWMKRALEIARGGESSYGAVILSPDGEVLGEAANSVFEDNDPCAHAEINALRVAGRDHGVEAITGATIYSTAEPCAMCAAACSWARIDRIVWGVSIERLVAISRQLRLPCREVATCDPDQRVRIEGGVLEGPCWEEALRYHCGGEEEDKKGD